MRPSEMGDGWGVWKEEVPVAARRSWFPFHLLGKNTLIKSSLVCSQFQGTVRHGEDITTAGAQGSWLHYIHNQEERAQIVCALIFHSHPVQDPLLREC